VSGAVLAAGLALPASTHAAPPAAESAGPTLQLRAPDPSEPPQAPIVVESLRLAGPEASRSLVHPGFTATLPVGEAAGYGTLSGLTINPGIRSLAGGVPWLSTPGIMSGVSKGFGLEFAAGISLGRWSTGPVLGIAAAGVPFGGFTPRGAALPLGFEAQMAAERTIQSLGWEVSYLAFTRSWALQPYARLSYEIETQGLLREFGPQGLDIARGGFGFGRERSYFSLGTGVATRLDGAFSLRLGYTAEVDRFDGWRQRFMTTLGYSF
jgi:uncharacterized protein YhjY with autotransporter beta-barrel domain